MELEKLLRDFGGKVQNLEASGEWTLTAFDYIIEETKQALTELIDKAYERGYKDRHETAEIEAEELVSQVTAARQEELNWVDQNYSNEMFWDWFQERKAALKPSKDRSEDEEAMLPQTPLPGYLKKAMDDMRPTAPRNIQSAKPNPDSVEERSEDE